MKKSISVILAFVMLVSFVACSSTNASPQASTSQTAPQASQAEQTTAKDEGKIEPANLTFWYWADSTHDSDLIKSIVKKFNETNEYGITITPEEHPWDGGAFATTLLNTCVGGGGPDISEFRTMSTMNFVENDLIYNLDDLVNAWDQKGDVPDSLWNEMITSSKTDSIYLMPWMFQILYVYYRPSYFEMAGVNKIPETYDEFLEAIKKCTMDTNKDGVTDIYGFGLRGLAGGHEAWGSFMHGAGGSWTDFTSADALKGMQDYLDVFYNGYAPPTATSDGFTEIIAGFTSGLTAMTIHHIGSSKQMTDAFGDDVGAFPFPKGKNRWTSLGSNNIAILKRCNNPKAAFEFAKFLTAGEGGRMWSAGTGNIPATKTLQADPELSSNRFFKTSVDSIDFASTYPLTPTTAEWVATTWPQTMGQAFLKQISKEDALKILYDGLYNK